MKLLFDQNLSPRLIEALSDIFPGSSHVFLEGKDRASDQEVLELALRDRFCLVTKDSDFSDLVSVRGFPPKVVWIRRGNCSTEEIEEVLRDRHPAIEAFSDDEETGLLVIY